MGRPHPTYATVVSLRFEWGSPLGNHSWEYRETGIGHYIPILLFPLEAPHMVLSVPFLPFPFWTLILSFFITFFHVCIFHLLCSCLMKVWSKFLVNNFYQKCAWVERQRYISFIIRRYHVCNFFRFILWNCKFPWQKKKWKKKKLPGLYALNLATQDDTILKYNHYFFISATHKKQINYKLYELIIIKWSNFFKWPVRFIFFPQSHILEVGASMQNVF